MTKERKKFILSVFRSYYENKQALKILSIKPLNEMTLSEKSYLENLKKKIEVVDFILEGESYQDKNRKNFITGCLINGKSCNSVSFFCYTSERTLRRWRQDVLDKADARMRNVGM